VLLCVLYVTVVPLPAGKEPFAVQLSNDNYWISIIIGSKTPELTSQNPVNSSQDFGHWFSISGCLININCERMGLGVWRGHKLGLDCQPVNEQVKV
jgi:hypothetical protein